MARNKILVAEDNPLQLKILISILEKEGYKVCGKSDGLEVVKVAKEFKPDLLMLDMKMPGLTGLEVCQQLKRDPEFKDTPVIFLTAYKDTDLFVEAFKAGAIDYISKPYSRDEIVARLGAQLKYRELADEKMELIKILEKSTNDRIMGKLSVGLAHNFNNMLTSAMGYCQLVEMSAMQPKNKERILIVKKVLDDMHRMISSLSDFSDRSESVKTNVDLTQILKNKSEELLSSSFPDLNVNIESRIQLSETVLDIDTQSFKTCLYNIYKNSVEHCDQGETKISIIVSKVKLPVAIKNRVVGHNLESDFLRIEFIDNGSGFETEVINPLEIFEPFWTTKKTVGVGLGLSVVHGFVARHNGFVNAYRNEPGKGVTIEIYLPIVQ